MTGGEAVELVLGSWRDLIVLRSATGRVATDSGLGILDTARAVAVVAEAGAFVISGGGTGWANLRSSGAPAPLVEVVLEREGPLPDGSAAPDASAAPEGGGALTISHLELARAAANRFSLSVEAPGRCSITMAFEPSAAPRREAGDAAGGDARGGDAGAAGSTGGGRAGPDDGERLLLEMWSRLATQQEDLAALRDDVAALSEELAATNSGMVAMYDELERARDAEAQLAAIVRSSDDGMITLTPELVVASWNDGAERLFGYHGDDIVERPIRTLLLDDSEDELIEATDRLAGGSRAAHFDTWARRRDGSSVEVEVALTTLRGAEDRLNGYSAVISDLTERRQVEEELSTVRAISEVLADRDRIARNLHDLVIQRIFGSGMSLQAALGFFPPPEVASRIRQVTDDLDTTIAEIRTTIFSLQRSPGQAASLRAQLLDIASQAADGLGFEPHLRFTGPVDAAVEGEVATNLLAVVREALSNAARHAGASRVEVAVVASDDLVLTVTDNGRGIGPTTRRSGLANMGDRARALGGSFAATTAVGGGTHLEWRVPLSEARSD
ncbi:MAG TPA: sensor histidine kinase [Acidimicrobiales bacterium]|nr:sensor histidine kinase [Acidimicrobiales bacterium]